MHLSSEDDKLKGKFESSVMPEPDFGRSVNPILTGGGQIIPTKYHWPQPKFFTFRHHYSNLIVFASAKVGLPIVSFSIVLITYDRNLLVMTDDCYDPKMKLSVVLYWQMQRLFVMLL